MKTYIIKFFIAGSILLKSPCLMAEETKINVEKNMNKKPELSELEYKVIHEKGTEPPFRNEYWENKEEGIYVDKVSGEPLFSSKDKYDSGTGWPSFSKPINKEEIQEVSDASHGMVRTEVRGKSGDSHLGHVFNDGPGPDRQRFCINSASLRFIPKEEMEKEGYAHLLSLFEK